MAKQDVLTVDSLENPFEEELEQISKLIEEIFIKHLSNSSYAVEKISV